MNLAWFGTSKLCLCLDYLPSQKSQKTIFYPFFTMSPSPSLFADSPSPSFYLRPFKTFISSPYRKSLSSWQVSLSPNTLCI